MEIVTDLNRRAIDWQRLCELLKAAGLGKRDPHTLRRVYQHSQFCYWGFIGDKLIATAHAISDLTSVAYGRRGDRSALSGAGIGAPVDGSGDARPGATRQDFHLFRPGKAGLL